jgi:hypothetical protein
METQLGAIDSMEILGDEDRRLLRAMLMVSYGLYHKAAGLLEQCLGKYPKDRGMKELLGGLYMEMKRPDKAMEIQ